MIHDQAVQEIMLSLQLNYTKSNFLPFALFSQRVTKQRNHADRKLFFVFDPRSTPKKRKRQKKRWQHRAEKRPTRREELLTSPQFRREEFSAVTQLAEGCVAIATLPIKACVVMQNQGRQDFEKKKLLHFQSLWFWPGWQLQFPHEWVLLDPSQFWAGDAPSPLPTPRTSRLLRPAAILLTSNVVNKYTVNKRYENQICALSTLWQCQRLV